MTLTTAQKAGVAAAAVAAAAALIYFVPPLRRGAKVLWEGDKRAMRKRAALKSLKRIEESVEAAEKIAKSLRLRAEAVPRAKAVDGEEGKRKPGDVDCGYYYFRSDGTRVKNKWDSFNVDEELAAISDDEGDAAKPKDKGRSRGDAKAKRAPPAAKAGVHPGSKLVNELNQREHDFEKVLTVLDQVACGDLPEVKMERKALVQRMQRLLEVNDETRRILAARMTPPTPPPEEASSESAAGAGKGASTPPEAAGK